MKLPVVLAVLIGTLVLACSTVTPAPAEPTLNIDATVEAKVAQERAMDATVEAKVSGTLSAQESKTPSTTQAACKLTGGETVQSGWTGGDTGNNSCNSCFCTNGALGCTKMACPAHQGSSDSKPAPTRRATSTAKPVVNTTELPEPSFTKVRPTEALVSTLSPTPTPTPRPTPTHTPRPAPTPNAYSYYEKGEGHRRTGNLVMAIGEYTKAIGLDSQFRNAYFYRAYSYSELGMEQDAISDYSMAIQILPGGAAYNNRSISYSALGQYANANADMTQACSLDIKYCPPPTPTPVPIPTPTATLTPTPTPTPTPAPTCPAISGPSGVGIWNPTFGYSVIVPEGWSLSTASDGAWEINSNDGTAHFIIMAVSGNSPYDLYSLHALSSLPLLYDYLSYWEIYDANVTSGQEATLYGTTTISSAFTRSVGRGLGVVRSVGPGCDVISLVWAAIGSYESDIGTTIEMIEASFFNSLP